MFLFRLIACCEEGSFERFVCGKQKLARQSIERNRSHSFTINFSAKANWRSVGLLSRSGATFARTMSDERAKSPRMVHLQREPEAVQMVLLVLGRVTRWKFFTGNASFDLDFTSTIV